MPCWKIPVWMIRYRVYFKTEGRTVEDCMNRGGEQDKVACSVKAQVAMLLSLREAGELRKVKPDG